PTKTWRTWLTGCVWSARYFATSRSKRVEAIAELLFQRLDDPSSRGQGRCVPCLVLSAFLLSALCSPLSTGRTKSREQRARNHPPARACTGGTPWRTLGSSSLSSPLWSILG